MLTGIDEGTLGIDYYQPGGVVIDRIELGTYMLAPAIAGGTVDLPGGRLDLADERNKTIGRCDDRPVCLRHDPFGISEESEDADRNE